MPINLRTIVLSSFILCAGAAHADSFDAWLKSTDISVGLLAYKETYSEKDSSTGEPFMKETAVMEGASIKLTTHASRRDTWGIVLKAAQSNSTKYTGAYQGEPYGSLVTKGHDRAMYDVGIGYEHDWVEFSNIKTGLSYNVRTLVDRLDQSGPGGYKRVNNLQSFSVALSKDFEWNGMTVTPQVSYHTLVSGKQHSYLSSVEGGRITNKQKEGSGLSLETSFNYTAGGFGITLTPFYKVMNIDDSDPVYLAYSNGTPAGVAIEPKNKTVEVGLGLAVSF